MVVLLIVVTCVLFKFFVLRFCLADWFGVVYVGVAVNTVGCGCRYLIIGHFVCDLRCVLFCCWFCGL